MNIKQNVVHKQPGSQILKPGQKVYLYGDRCNEEIFSIAIAVISGTE
ncbi:MAG: hypothetical protein AAGA80_12795 [Cyanobacteria bacterium P01_F01_bin.143]